MEVYILDNLLRRIDVFDRFESLIWTERWQEIGDFELDIKSTLETRGRFTTGTRIAINDSYRVMTVETVEDNVDGDGKEILHVKGRSLESLLEDRAAANALSDDPDFNIAAAPPAIIARSLFDYICGTGFLSLDDKIPFLVEGTIFPESTIPESDTPITWKHEPDSLYNMIRKICGLYDLGFRLVRNFDTSQLYFDIYTGNDRTTLQDGLPPVIFSVNLDNLQNTTEFSSIQKSKNVAYVFSDAGALVVYGDGVSPDVEGFDRRVIAVNASVEVDDPDANTIMTQAGKEALMNNRASALFDGELNEYSDYKYGVDYDVGDLVEMRNKDGIISYKRVTEQIFVSDKTGERSYPTLSLDMFAGLNTWISMIKDPTVWEDMTVETWADM